MLKLFKTKPAKTAQVCAQIPGPVGPMGPAGKPARYRAPKFTLADGAPEGHPVPRRAHAGDAGYDLALASTKPVSIPSGARATVSVGVSVKLDPATVGLILPRSGNASKLGLNVITGVVDAGYTGPLKVTLHNMSAKRIVLSPGARVAQLVATPVATCDDTDKPERGDAGFGSTGTAGKAEAPVVGGGSKRELAHYVHRTLEANKADMVNHPPHYTIHPVFHGECHDYAKYMMFDPGNAFKYLWRCAAKNDMRENIEKAAWYLKAVLNGTGELEPIPMPLMLELEADAKRAMANTDKATAPKKYLVALCCYTAAALIAAGEPREALDMTNEALRRLNSVS